MTSKNEEQRAIVGTFNPRASRVRNGAKLRIIGGGGESSRLRDSYVSTSLYTVHIDQDDVSVQIILLSYLGTIT